MVDTSNVNRQLFDVMGSQIQALDFDSVFRVTVHAPTVWQLESPGGVYAPEQVLWADGKVVPESHLGWELLRGFSNSAGMDDGVQHPSEFIGGGIAQELVRLSEDGPQLFVCVMVECEATDDEVKEKAVELGVDYHTDEGWDMAREAADLEQEPVGWAILQKES